MRLEDEGMLLEDDEILLEDERISLEDKSALPEELLLSETELLESWLSAELELAGSFCLLDEESLPKIAELEDEFIAEFELIDSISSGNFRVQEINA